MKKEATRESDGYLIIVTTRFNAIPKLISGVHEHV